MISIVVALILQQDSKVCILKLVILVKLAFVMQKLKKYLYKFLSWSTTMGVTIFRFYGGTQLLWGRHRAHESPPSPPPPPPPTSENPERCQDKNKESLFLKQELKFFSQIYQGQSQDSGFWHPWQLLWTKCSGYYWSFALAHIRVWEAVKFDNI